MLLFSLLPSPPQFFSHFLRLTLSVFTSKLHIRKQVIAKRRSPYSYDINQHTGFFPPEPLPKLPPQFGLWEQALRDANGNLSLGEDESEEALERRPYGATWRARIEAVRLLPSSSPRFGTDSLDSGLLSAPGLCTTTYVRLNELTSYWHGSSASTPTPFPQRLSKESERSH